MNAGPGITAELPVLTDEQFASVARRGTRHPTQFRELMAADAEVGFIRTDRDLRSQDLDTTWPLLGRAPLPFETSVPGVFAALARGA